MRSVRIAVLVLVLSLSLASVAVAGRIEVGGSPTPHLSVRMSGSDSYGKVTLILHTGPGGAVSLTNLRFASECSHAGIVMPGKILIDRHGKLHRDSGGFLVTGAVSNDHQRGQVKASVTQFGDCDGDADTVPFVVKIPR
jgi:hypothetical protein